MSRQTFVVAGARVWDGASFSAPADIEVRDGRIAAVAPERPLPNGDGGRVDARGLFALPGFVDGHIHPLSWSRQRDKVSLADCRSIDDVLSALRDACREQEPGGWVEAVGIGEGRLIREQRLPNRDELDAVSTRHRIFVAGGTLASVNSAALEASGLARAADAEVEGGRVHRDASGTPTGILLGRGAIDRVRRELPRPTPERDRETLEAFLRDLAALGVTAVVEYGSVDHETEFLEDYEPYRALHADGRLPIRCRVAYRVNVAAPVADEVARLRRADVRPAGQDDVLRVGPLKAFADGGVQAAFLRGDYAARPGYRGLSLLGADDVRALTAAALDGGWQLSLHALGGAAIDTILACWQGSSADVGGRRFSLQHAFDPSPENMRVCRELGVVVGIHQSLFYMYAPQMLDAWRGNVGERLNPVRSWLDAGVDLAGGSDIAPHDPLVAVGSLVTRQTESGSVVGGEEAVTVTEAIRLHTTGAAYGNFDESLYGSVAPGMAADVVLLDEDPTAVPAERLATIGRVATFVAGRPVFVSEPAAGRFASLAASGAATA